MNTINTRNRKAISGFGIASMAVGSMLFIGSGQVAHADTADTCDAALMTINKVDSVTGDAITNNAAKFVVKSAGNVFVVPGNHMNLESNFREAYDGLGTDRQAVDTAQWDAYFKIAHQAQADNALAPVYPSNITSITDNDARSDAYSAWYNGTRMVNLRANLQDRADNLDAVKAVMDSDARYATADPAYTANLLDAHTKVHALLDAMDVLQSYTANIATPSNWDTDWATLTAKYNYLVDVNNWTYGTSRMPTDKVLDLALWLNDGSHAAAVGKTTADTPDFSKTVNQDASQDAAATLSGVQSSFGNKQAVVTTDNAGAGVFTLFGVKDAAWEDGTRGDTTCSQLEATVTESQAPEGYTLDPTIFTIGATSNQTGELTINNTPENFVDPEVPIETATGL